MMSQLRCAIDRTSVFGRLVMTCENALSFAVVSNHQAHGARMHPLAYLGDS